MGLNSFTPCAKAVAPSRLAAKVCRITGGLSAANSVCSSNQWGLIVGWTCATANVADNTFQWLVRQFEEQMIVLSDTAFHAAEGIQPTSNCVSAASGRTVCSSRRCSRC